MHAFQTHLAQILKVLASTQNQALNPVAFLYHQVPKREPGEIDELPRARRLKDLPVVLSPAEVQKLLSNLTRTEHLLASLLYGSGLHLSKCVSLRAKDLDLDGRTTMNHTHVLAKGVLAIRSPLHELELPVWGRPPYAPSVVDVTSPQQKSGTWPDAANIAADQWVPEPKSPPSLESPDGSHLASGCS